MRSKTKVKVSKVTKLPDGSGFFTASFPLPKNHWLTAPSKDYEPPPMPFLIGEHDGVVLNRTRQMWAEDIMRAARWAIRASTNSGKIDDYDPDAMAQNMVVGMIGYYTRDGLSKDAWANDPGAVKRAKAKRHGQG